MAEIINATLHTHPRPAPTHGEASSNLGFELGPPFGRGRGGLGGWRSELLVWADDDRNRNLPGVPFAAIWTHLEPVARETSR